MRPTVPWIAAMVAIVAFVLATVLSPVQDHGARVVFLGIIVALMFVGTLLMTRVPGNRVGAMPLTAGILMCAAVTVGGLPATIAVRPTRAGVWLRGSKR